MPPKKPIRASSILNALPVLRGLVAERDMCELICDSAAQQGAPIFLIIHGTWANNATWTQIDSALLAGFRTAWPTAGFYRFNWSGVNGARHRLEAAKRLAVELSVLSHRFPNSPIIAISHSHGGNVLAWSTTSIPRPLSAAIYLNTPFIQVLEPPGRLPENKSRDALRTLSFIAYFPSVLAIISVVIGIPLIKLQNLIYFLPPFSLSVLPLSFLALLVLGLTAVTAAPFVAVWCTKKFAVAPIQKLSEETAAISAARRNISRELVVNAVGDEGASMLGGIYIANWLAQRIIIYLTIGSLSTGLISVFISRAFPTLLPLKVLLGIPLILLGLVLTLIFIIALVSTASYGFLQGLIALDSHVTVSLSPVGLVEAMTVYWKHESQFHHSALHDSLEVSDAIRDWLTSLLH